MPDPIPARLRWAMETLAVQPDERILEIGCGRGVAVDLACRMLVSGSVTGIDRSPAAIEAAESRNQAHLRSGRARLQAVSLADASLEPGFDTVFAVNVNLFWRDPSRELRVIRTILSGSGRLYLFFEPPSEAQLEKARGCTRHLRDHGFRVERVVRADLESRPGLCVIAAAPA